MNIYNSRRWFDDLDETIAVFSSIKRFAGSSILITGATGLIGSAIVDLIIRWNESSDEKIFIFAAGRSEEGVKVRFGRYAKEDWLCFVRYDAVSGVIEQDVECDYIICAAGNASPDLIVKQPVETLVGNINGTRSILDYAKKNSVKRVLYVSSSEVYGNKTEDRPFRTDEYGYIDILNYRNSYSVGKRAGETLCISYAEEYGVDVCIVRPGHIYGPTAKESDVRVSSLWAYAAAKKQDIVMKSDGAQLRSYCHCLDCATAFLTILLKGEKGCAYNISDPTSVISIRELGEAIAKAGGVNVKRQEASDTEKKGFNPMKNSSLCADELIKLDWKALFSYEKGLSHTVSVIREACS